jgi:hypothetical protein
MHRWAYLSDRRGRGGREKFDKQAPFARDTSSVAFLRIDRMLMDLAVFLRRRAHRRRGNAGYSREIVTTLHHR